MCLRYYYAAVRRALPLVLLLPLLVAAAIVARNLGFWLSSPDAKAPVDVIVVASGDPEQRVPAALDLADDGLADEVWVMAEDGPVVDAAGNIESYAERRRFAGTVRVIGGSAGVYSDAHIVRGRIERSSEHVDRIAVVTAPTLVARTRIAYGRTLGIQVRVWDDGSPYDAARWWRSDQFGTAIEAVKTAAMLALLGPLPEQFGERPSPTIPIRAVIGGALGALLAGYACRPLARRLGMVSLPRMWRAHSEPTPMLGGLAILAGLAVGVIAGGGVSVGGLGVVAAGGVGILALVGFVDDVAGLPAWSRLGWTALAAAAAWLLGLRVELFTTGGPLELVDLGLTLLWFVGITHAVNFLDNVDGATAGVAAVSSATVAVVAVTGGQFVVAVAAAALAGACLGYLVHNFPPARLFMGDMGALAVGFALASLTLALRPTQTPPLSIGVAVLALGVPIFDMTLVTISRLRARSSPAKGGTDHTAHRLLERGYSLRKVVLTLVGAQLVLGGLAVALAVSLRSVGWAIAVLAAVLGPAALVVMLRLRPWTPPAHAEASEEVRHALGRALEAIRAFEQTANQAGLDLSDPVTARALREGTRRLEAMHARLTGDVP